MNFVAIRTAIFSDLTMEFSRLRTTAKKGKGRGEDKPPALLLPKPEPASQPLNIANPVDHSLGATERIGNLGLGRFVLPRIH